MKKFALLVLVAVCLGAGGVKAETPVETAPAKTRAERCPPPPGSRLSKAPDADGRCDSAGPMARSYSREDLERTGQIDLDRALQQLDPSLTRGR